MSRPPQNRSSHEWFRRTDLPWSKAIWIGVGVFTLFTLLTQVPGGNWIEEKITHPVEFRLRARLGLGPKLSPYLLPFGLDEIAFGKLGKESLGIEDWTELFDAVGDENPRMILIDKRFDQALSKDPEQWEHFRAAIKKAKKVGVGAFWFPEIIKHRNPISTEDFELNKLPEDYKNSEAGKAQGYSYGPHRSVLPSFSLIGHVNYEDNGYFQPIIPLPNGDYLPHWGLLAKHPRVLKFDDENLSLGGSLIGRTFEKQVLINMMSFDDAAEGVYGLDDLLEAAKNRTGLDGIHPSHIIVFLTGLHLGDASLKLTPLGSMPGSYINLSIANSAISGNWLTPIRGRYIWLFFICLFATIAATALRTFWVTTSMIVATSVIVGVGLYAFIYQGMLVPWGLWAFGCLVTGSIVFGERLRTSGKKGQLLRTSLDGVIDNEKLEYLIRNRDKVILDPSNQSLTLMFVDMVHFSVAAEKHPPKEVFEYLRTTLDHLTPILLRHGAVIDKTMGDGLFCFFGYQYHTEGNETDHAQSALRCAIEIQIEHTRKSLSMNSGIFHPLRIGIHTGDVYVGDIGGQKRIDFTLIGHDVNFAQRMEAACESWSVTCSPATYDRLSKLPEFEGRFFPRNVQIKHHSEFQVAYELDPFNEDPALRNTGIEAFRESVGVVRKDERWAIDPKTPLMLNSDIGTAQVLNFSHSGLLIRLEKYYGVGVSFGLHFHFDDPVIDARCTQEGLSHPNTQISWGRPIENGYLHGVFYKDLTQEQKDLLVELLRQRVSVLKAVG